MFAKVKEQPGFTLQRRASQRGVRARIPRMRKGRPWKGRSPVRPEGMCEIRRGNHRRDTG